jgi:hypothetical protein
MKSYIQTIISVLLVSMVFIQKPSFSQDKKDTVEEITPNLSLVYLSNSNDTVILTANIFARKETGTFSLENAEIAFSLSDGKVIKSLGTVKTGYDGNAILKVPVKSGLLKDKDGKTTYTANFSQKGNYLATSAEVTVKLAQIQLTFSKVDSIHTIHVKAIQTEGNNELKPVPNETVSIYVPRMLSDLKIGEITLDENGTGSIEYTGGLVGDSLGNLLVVAKIEENDNFGNVRGQSSVSWGIPKQYFLAERPARELWTPIAPVWMIITLIIMLAGVWGHYIYAVIQLISIKRHSKQKKDYL